MNKINLKKRKIRSNRGGRRNNLQLNIDEELKLNNFQDVLLFFCQ
jgi:hypothetical protein